MWNAATAVVTVVETILSVLLIAFELVTAEIHATASCLPTLRLPVTVVVETIVEKPLATLLRTVVVVVESMASVLLTAF